MPKDAEGKALRTVHTYWTVIIAFAVLVVGVAFLYVSSVPWFARRPALGTLITQLGALLVVTGGIYLLWDLKGRRAFAEEVLAKAQIAADVRSSGLQRLSMQWLEDVAWADMFRRAKEVEIFVSYGASWRNIHWPRLEEFSEQSGHKLRVYLPDPSDDVTVSVLAQRYDSTRDRMIEQISDAAKAYASLKRQRGGADIRVYYRRGDPIFACYRFDNEIVVTFYSHRRTRGNVPTLLLGRGTLYDFFVNEFEAIREQSEEQAHSALIGGGQ